MKISELENFLTKKGFKKINEYIWSNKEGLILNINKELFKTEIIALHYSICGKDLKNNTILEEITQSFEESFLEV